MIPAGQSPHEHLTHVSSPTVTFFIQPASEEALKAIFIKEIYGVIMPQRLERATP